MMSRIFNTPRSAAPRPPGSSPLTTTAALAGGAARPGPLTPAEASTPPGPPTYQGLRPATASDLPGPRTGLRTGAWTGVAPDPATATAPATPPRLIASRVAPRTPRGRFWV